MISKIPTIEHIVASLLGGIITSAQAIDWLHEHARFARSNESDLRDRFAAKAMQALMMDARFDLRHDPAIVADRAYEMAAAMLRERNL